jgi:acetoin:2,6-dichlorophenolindophenol oxidoreductase subunit beta
MREINMAQALNEALFQCMTEDERVYVLGEGVVTGTFGVTKGLVDRFGRDRVINTPLSEASFTGMAVGAASTGMRPVVEIMMMDFITMAMDMVANQAAKMSFISGGQTCCPVVIRTAAGGGRGKGAGALHSQNLSAWFMHVPGIKVVAPSTPYDAKGLLIASIRDPNPVLFVEFRLMYADKGPVPEEPFEIPLGEADIKREGKDASLITYGRMVQVALEAAGRLASQGIDLEVIDLRSLVPLDEETIVESVRKTGRLVTIDESYERAGVGSEITAVVMRQLSSLKAPVLTIACPNAPVPVSPVLEKLYYPNGASVSARIEKLFKG